jgi:UDP:flavonoid glycosyltransferase YjiC (YdhE family)
MRILFTFAGGAGHFIPLAPIARAAETAGHVVAVGSQPALLQTVQRAGFSAMDTGGVTFRDDSIRAPLLALDMEREYRAVSNSYAGRIARTRAAAIIALCAEWKPDLLVCDEMDFGSMIAAECLRIPHATVLVNATGSFIRPHLITEPLNELRAEFGLPPDPELVMLRRYLVLSPFPPSYRDPEFPLPPTGHPFHSVPMLEAVNKAPEWLENLPKSPTVYFTLGTVFNVESGDLFSRILDGLRSLSINVIVTVGPQIDPQELGPQPANVYVERYIDQWLVLPHCDLVVSHGGSGTINGALTHGLPMVLLPMGADQSLNARRCEDLTIARVLDPVTATPELVKETVSAVFDNPGFRQAAAHMKEEIATLPDQMHAVNLLERLAAEKTPVLAQH